MEMNLSFDDILLKPADWTSIKSRAEVFTESIIFEDRNTKYYLNLPMISSNMDTVYSPNLSKAVITNGGMSAVHRFCDIDENIKLFKGGVVRNFAGENVVKPWVSVGVSPEELKRCEALVAAGAETVIIDLANAANDQAAAMFNEIKHWKDICKVVVGNFATKEQIKAFQYHTNNHPFIAKVSIGSGSACTTRLNTGIGVPSFSCLQDCVKSGVPIIFDGGIKNGGDFAKALAAGASAVMVGRLFAACEESPGEIVPGNESWFNIGPTPQPYPHNIKYKKYRGSASAESYEVQGKTAAHRGPEGESFLIPVSGTVEKLMNNFNGWLRSSMTQCDARNLSELRENAEFIRVSDSSKVENSAYGKNS